MLFLVFTYFELLSDIVRKKIPLLTQLEYLLNFVPVSAVPDHAFGRAADRAGDVRA